MKLRLPDLGILKPGSRTDSAARSEIRHLSRITLYSLAAVALICLVMMSLLHFFGGGIGPWSMHVSNAMDNILAAVIILIFLDTVMMMNSENRKKRDERRSIIRMNKIIQPIADMYIVRKNMVVTPSEKTVRKFQVVTDSSVRDMKDMYGSSELVSDVGRSKIDVYAFYQSKLMDSMIHLVESVDFSFYQDLCDAAMKYINATMYGASALESVLSYQGTMAGTRSMKSVISGMIKEDSGASFAEANPSMKNVYLVYQTIKEQETALAEYLKAMQIIMGEEPPEKRDHE